MKLIHTITFLLFAIAVGSLLAIALIGLPPLENATADDLAACFEKPDTASGQRCFRDVVHSLLLSTTTASLMNYMVAPSSPDTVVQNCHPIAHVVGRATFEKSESLESALEACGENCEHGCAHGVIGAAVEEELGETYSEDIAHADAEVLEAVGAKYCSLSGAICHAVGHLLFIANEADLPSLETCEIAAGAKEERAEACYEGVFMEALGSRNSLVFRDALETDAESAIRHCTEIPARYQYACFLYSPALHYHNLIAEQESPVDTPEEISVASAMCTKLPERQRAHCMLALAGSIPSKAHAKTYCDTLTSADRAACILGVVRRYTLDQDYRGALNYCSKTAADMSLCHNVTFQKMTNKKDANLEELRKACETTGNPLLCLENYRHFVDVRLTLPEYQFGLFGNPL